jgi:hypothetical protein
MNEILGAALKRRIRKAKGKRLLDRAKRLAALKKRLAGRKFKKARSARAMAKKPAAQKIIARLPVATKKALIKRAILKKPALKKKLVLAVLKKKLQARKAGAFVPLTMRQSTPVPAVSPAAPPVPDPASASIPPEEALTPAQAVEEETMERPLEEAAQEEAAEEEGAEEAAEEATEEQAAESQAEDEAAELSEPDEEEQAEQAEEAAEDEAAATEAAGENEILGAFFGRRMSQLRRRSRINRALTRCAPLARKLESVTGGALPAKRTMKAVKVVAKAKGGDKKAKKGVKALVKKAKKGDKKAKKAVAQLHVANKMIKKTKPKAKKTAPKKIVKKVKVPYQKKVVVRNTGLLSYSAHQRGLAMIPGFARGRYGSP